jgi:CO/xanthine dehydrogenase Mo-binding subunit
MTEEQARGLTGVTPDIANQALDLIDVTYEVLPLVIDVNRAMAPGAPISHEDLFTAGVEPKSHTPSNVAKVGTFKKK